MYVAMKTLSSAAMPVTLLDVNLLVALAWPQHVHHSIAHKWFGRDARRRWATCPLTQLAFVRISSNPKIIPTAVSPRDAAALLIRIVRMPRHFFWEDDLAVTESTLFRSALLVGHRQVTDAYLIESARRHQGRLATLDAGIADLLVTADERSRFVEYIA